MDTLEKLLQVLMLASDHYNTLEFTYEWEWEMYMLPTQTIYMNDQGIHTTHDIYFDFGERELDELVSKGHLEKLEKIEEKQLFRITYRLKELHKNKQDGNN